MTNVLAHAIPQVEPPAVGVHLLWTGPWQWVWSLDGWSIQRREFRRTNRERVCVRLGDAELAELRRTHRRATQLGPVTFRIDSWMESACEVYTLELTEPTAAVNVSATAGRFLAIALRQNQAVGHVTGAGNVSGQVRADGITSIVVYAIKMSALEWCVERADRESEDRAWDQVPFLVEHLQLPITELVPALGGAIGELAEATARLLPGDTLADDDFEHIADTLRVSVAAVSPPRPADQVALLRADPGDDLDESMAVDPLRVLMSHPTWRRVLGFGWFDGDPALIPGQVYEYRITGSFPAEDLADRVYGFHTAPAGTPLPACFWIGDLRVRLPQPATVALDPTAVDAGGTTELSRRGIEIRPRDETWWQAPDIDGNSVVIDFATPVDSVILEMAAGAAISWKTFTHSGTVTAGPRARIDPPGSFTQLRLSGKGFLFAVRVPDATVPAGVTTRSAVVSPVALVNTLRPARPLTASISNLQDDPGVLDAGTPPPPRHDLGFDVRWQPAPTGPPVVWPPGAPAPPPLDATVYELEHRTVGASGNGPWEPVLADDAGSSHWTLGSRDETASDHAVTPGGDLLEIYPEPGASAIGPGLDVHWLDVFDLASPSGDFVRSVPEPGTFHQYRVRTIDAIGRPSDDWRETNVLRLEKHVPPPLPSGPTIPPVDGHDTPQPNGVFARALVKGAPDLTAADLALLGADDDAVVLSWGWHEQQRDQDPFAREFRVYLADHRLDRMQATITSVAPAGTGRYTLTVDIPAPLISDELIGTWVHASYPFRVTSNTAGATGSPATIDVEANVPLTSGALPVPIAGPVELTLRLTPNRARPPGWTERAGTAPISAATSYQWVFRNVLHLNAARPSNAIWVGVSAADDQSYVDDQLAPVETRPGNESGIAAVSVSARYHGRPVFDVPPSLAQVPVVLTPEVNGRQLRYRLDLTPFVIAGGLGAGDAVLPERVAADAVFASYRVTNDGRVMALVIDPRPGDIEAEVIVPNPTDRAAVVAALQGNRTDGLDDRFAVFLAGSHPFRDRLFTRVAESPIPLGPFDDVLPSEPGRFVYRFRLADAAGHLSAGAVTAGCVVRVPSTLAPGAPDRLPAAAGDPPGRIRLHVAPEADIGSVLTFVDGAPTGAADSAAIIRVPNRTDLPIADSIRLRTDAGAVLAPRESALPPPDNDGWRSVVVTEPGNDGDVKRVWAATLSIDGVPSAIAGPWTLRWPPAPLAAPVLAANATPSTIELTWTWPGAPSGVVAVERLVDGAWRRISPMLDTATVWTGARPAGASRLRLRVSGIDGRSAHSNEVTVP
jgi:hypothetical protein